MTPEGGRTRFADLKGPNYRGRIHAAGQEEWGGTFLWGKGGKKGEKEGMQVLRKRLTIGWKTLLSGVFNLKDEVARGGKRSNKDNILRELQGRGREGS